MTGLSSVSLPAEILQASDVIKNGGIVAFPTETFYGLAVDPFNPEALNRLFELKRRSADKPVLVLIDKPERLSMLVQHIPHVYEPLMKKLWPGPLTLIFEGLDGLPGLLTDSLGTVGIRWSSDPFACQLAKASGGVITGTSANPSGQSPAVSADQVKCLFPTGIDHVLDGGSAPGGSGSTIVSLRDHQFFPIREGAISFSTVLASAVPEH